ncbi:MAG: hypothetical protein K9L71_00415 [Candidatus Omnitrophica bacterium]|nr:hypothetical protein [Candidatus Omnitrophota bacterium]
MQEFTAATNKSSGLQKPEGPPKSTGVATSISSLAWPDSLPILSFRQSSL